MPNDRSTPPSWPSHVQRITLEDLDRLGVDASGALYWDGRPVEVRRSVSLTLAQKVGAFLITASAVVAAVSAGVSAYADLQPLLAS